MRSIFERSRVIHIICTFHCRTMFVRLHYEPGSAADGDYRNDAGLVAEQRDYRTESDQ